MKQVTIRRCPECPKIKLQTEAIVAGLQRDPNVNVRVVDGAKGSFSVEVNGRYVAQMTGEMMPTVQEVVSAVQGEAVAGAR